MNWIKKFPHFKGKALFISTRSFAKPAQDFIIPEAETPFL